MELLLLIGFGIFMFGKWIYNEATKNRHVFTHEELKAMNMEMLGKSKKECQRIIDKYSK